MRFQLRAVERKWLPTLGATLLQHSADGGVGSVGCEGESCAFARVKKHGCFRQGLFGRLEGSLTLGGPLKRLGFALKGLEEVVEVGGGVGDEFPVVADHPEKPLQLLDGGRRRCGANHRDLLRKRRYAVFVDGVTQKLEAGFPKDAFGALNDQSIGRESLENRFQVLQMLLERF